MYGLVMLLKSVQKYVIKLWDCSLFCSRVAKTGAYIINSFITGLDWPLREMNCVAAIFLVFVLGYLPCIIQMHYCLL